ncbi:hypothetical protein [Salininema proteolyticum]|uniref:Uncharacterized protein n=1 Tax=Salininema proteolyticum TaxID=1607685 RepID=A0ABV8U257_9ACTN
MSDDPTPRAPRTADTVLYVSIALWVLALAVLLPSAFRTVLARPTDDRALVLFEWVLISGPAVIALLAFLLRSRTIARAFLMAAAVLLLTKTALAGAAYLDRDGPPERPSEEEEYYEQFDESPGG